MCLLCLGPGGAANHFAKFLLPQQQQQPQPQPQPPTTVPAPSQQQSIQAGSGCQQSAAQFAGSALMGLAQADRTPAQQQSLLTTMTVLSALNSGK